MSEQRLSAADVADRYGCGRRKACAIIRAILNVEPRNYFNDLDVSEGPLADWVAAMDSAQPIASPRKAQRGTPLVYFLADSGFVKIGHTTDIRKRLSDLQKANPRKLILLAAFSGGAAEEAFFHGKFAHLWVRDEWFRVDLEVRRLCRRERVPA